MTALELADALEAEPDCTCHAASYYECCCDATWPEQFIQHAARKLRSLHAEVERLNAEIEEVDSDGSRCGIYRRKV